MGQAAEEAARSRRPSGGSEVGGDHQRAIAEIEALKSQLQGKMHAGESKGDWEREREELGVWRIEWEEEMQSGAASSGR